MFREAEAQSVGQFALVAEVCLHLVTHVFGKTAAVDIKGVAGKRGAVASFTSLTSDVVGARGERYEIVAHRDADIHPEVIFRRDIGEFRSFVAGLVNHLADVTLLGAPNINSYKRYQPESWAPTATVWALDNRTAGLRLVGTGPGLRIESRIPGADANPYLAFAGVIAAGLAGIEEGLDCGPPYDGNAYAAGAEGDTALTHVPWNLPDATEAFRNSEVAQKALGLAKALGGNQVQLYRDLHSREAPGNVVSMPHTGRGAVVRSLAAAVDVRDGYTHEHSRLVSELSAAVAQCIGLATAEIVERNVLRALQPACRVPRRLAMANVVDDGRGHRICDYSLTGETSGRLPGIRHGFGDIRLPSSFRPVCWYTSTLLRYSPNRRGINAVLRRLRLPE